MKRGTRDAMLMLALTTPLFPLGSGACGQTPPRLGQSPTKDVIAAMTREEKIGLVMGTGMRVPMLPPDMRGPEVGQIEEGVPGAAGATLAVPRLGIPSIVLADGPAGLRIQPERPDDPNTYDCTAFPIATLLASSWDQDLVERVGRAVGGELRAYGVDVLLAPALNLHRNPLGGRNFEYYSEDPLVTGRLAAAMVKGVQSRGVGTSLKHYVANNHEWNRNVIDVQVSQRALRELYLRGFEIAVREAKPWTVMSSYNRLNGAYTSESADLLTGVLRDDWGFDGVVMTDWFGGADAVAQMEAGNDLLMPGTERQRRALLDALERGQLSEEVLDRNLERILSLIQRSPAFLGLEADDAPDLESNARVAREAAAQGMVLLRNEDALPLASGLRLAVFGNSSYRMITGGTGSGDVNEAYSISLPQGLEEAGLRFDRSLAERYAAYLEKAEAERPPAVPFRVPSPIPEMEIAVDEIERLAEETESALLTLGRRSGEFEDRRLEDDFELSNTEQQLVATVSEAFRARGKKLVVVLNVGGVIETMSWRERADAILLAWQPGQEGGRAVVDVLTGRTPPSGRLATSFPVRWEDLPSSEGFPGETLEGPDPEASGPFVTDRAARVVYQDEVWVGYRHLATRGVEPAYPFGFGLSYTRFAFSDLELSDEVFHGALTVRVRVENAGESAGREVVQVYLAKPGEAVPALELVAFAKTRTLEPGAAETLLFTLSARDLASFDEGAGAWVAAAGAYRVRVGASSEDLRQTASFTLAGAVPAEVVSTEVGSSP